MPKVSVVLTSFNHDRHIEEAIDSILGQTFDDFQLIVWDDASADNSWHLINRFADPRLEAFRNTEQKRAVWGLNEAISRVASGPYIAVHHSDDVWESNKLEKQVAFLDDHADIGAVFTNARAIDEGGSPLLDENHFYFRIFDQPNRARHEWLRFFFDGQNALCHPSVLIRRSCYENCGLYRFGLVQLCDLDMWVRLCMRYEIHVLPDKLVRFRVRDNNANTSSDTRENRTRASYESYRLLQNYRRLGSFADLAKVFPSAAKYYRDAIADIEFPLAMVALEGQRHAFTQLFGLDLLYEIISDRERAAAVDRFYGFDYKAFVALTAARDVFLACDIAYLDAHIGHLNEALARRDEHIARLDQALARRDEQIVALVGEREQFLHSRSWRVTAPLRYLRRKTGELLSDRGWPGHSWRDLPHSTKCSTIKTATTIPKLSDNDGISLRAQSVMKGLIIYGSTRGNTRLVATRMPDKLTFHADVQDVSCLRDVDVLHQYDVLVFLASTWGDGELQVDMERFLVGHPVDLSGKRYAICELGNYYGYDDFEFGALRILQYQLQQWGGRELVEPFCMDSLPRKDWAGFARWCNLLNRTVERECTT